MQNQAVETTVGWSETVSEWSSPPAESLVPPLGTNSDEALERVCRSGLQQRSPSSLFQHVLAKLSKPEGRWMSVAFENVSKLSSRNNTAQKNTQIQGEGTQLGLVVYRPYDLLWEVEQRCLDLTRFLTSGVSAGGLASCAGSLKSSSSSRSLLCR